MNKCFLPYLFLLSMSFHAAFGQEMELEPSFVQPEKSSVFKKTTVDYLFVLEDTLRLPFIDDFSQNLLATNEEPAQDTSFFQYKYKSKDSSFFASSFNGRLDAAFKTVYVGTDTQITALAAIDTLLVYDYTNYPLSAIDTLLLFPNYSLLDTNNSGNFDTTFYSILKNDSAEIGLVFPKSNLWTDRLAWINNSYALNQPSVGVATLDAVNEKGLVYSHGNTKAFLADSLTSKPIDLSPFTASSNLFLSFMVQPGGIGDAPEAEDILQLEFLKNDGDWEQVWASSSLTSTVVNVFTEVYVPVNTLDYYHNAFQFRFSNYASLSKQSSTWQNNADLWHLDYVILDSARSDQDNYIKDACFATVPSSHINGYFTVPFKHYQSNTSITKTTSSVEVRNYNLTANNLSFSTIITEDINTVYQDLSAGSSTLNDGGEYTFTQNYSGLVFSSSNFPGEFTVEHQLSPSQPDLIESNNSCSFTQSLEQFYAYDDGTSESGYGINAYDGSVAIRYPLLVSSDTLTAVDIYFNNTLTQANFEIPIQIMVWADNAGLPGDILYKGISQYPNAANTLNAFTSYLLDQPIVVSGTIYVGWKQLSDQVVNVGMDKSQIANDKLFYNVGSGWKNSGIEGAVMVHPRFGFEKFLSATVFSTREIKIFPNPAETSLQIETELSYDQVIIYNLQGEQCLSTNQIQSSINLTGLAEGLYFLCIYQNGILLESQKFIKD